jgi:hypothetical protein
VSVGTTTKRVGTVDYAYLSDADVGTASEVNLARINGIGTSSPVTVLINDDPDDSSPALRGMIARRFSEEPSVGASLSSTQVNGLVDECLNLATAAAAAGADVKRKDCASEPIFLPGGDNPMPTEVDYNALVIGQYANPATPHPELFQLHKLATRAGFSHYPSSSLCGPPNYNDGGALSCDEYPFAISSEGGDAATASLKPVDFRQNSREGWKLRDFFGFCAVTTGDSFLVLPMPNPAATKAPDVQTPPYSPSTFRVCDQ